MAFSTNNNNNNSNSNYDGPPSLEIFDNNNNNNNNNITSNSKYPIHIYHNSGRSSFSTLLVAPTQGFTTYDSFKVNVMTTANSYEITSFDILYKTSSNSPKYLIDKREIFEQIPWNESKLSFLIIKNVSNDNNNNNNKISKTNGSKGGKKTSQNDKFNDSINEAKSKLQMELPIDVKQCMNQKDWVKLPFLHFSQPDNYSIEKITLIIRSRTDNNNNNNNNSIDYDSDNNNTSNNIQRSNKRRKLSNLSFVHNHNNNKNTNNNISKNKPLTQKIETMEKSIQHIKSQVDQMMVVVTKMFNIIESQDCKNQEEEEGELENEYNQMMEQQEDEEIQHLNED
jgi:hypothetical protein